MNFLLRGITIIGNIVFILWMLNYAVARGSAISITEVMSYVSLIILLALNTSLLVQR